MHEDDAMEAFQLNHRTLIAAISERHSIGSLLTGEWKKRLVDLTNLLGQNLQEIQSERNSREQEWSNHVSKLREQLGVIATQRDGLIHQIEVIAAQRDDLIRQVTSLQSDIVSGSSQNSRRTAWLTSEKRAELDAMERQLTGTSIADPPIKIFGAGEYDESVRWRGLDWPQSALSMIGSVRMHNFRHLVEQAILDNIPGDIVETGVWRGGASIMAKAVIEAYGDKQRRVYLADSFEGLPPPDGEKYPHDKDLHLEHYEELAVSEEEVRRNFSRLGLLDDRVILVKGWFRDTMPSFPVETIAVLRLDGDLYESTIDPLRYLYDRVSKGGWIIVDDYDCFDACKAAVQDFIKERGISPEIRCIDGVGVFFKKV